MAVDVGMHRTSGQFQPVLLSGQRRHHLTASRHKGAEFLGDGVTHGTDRWTDRLGKAGQHEGIEAIGFSELPSGAVPRPGTRKGLRHCEYPD